jgi:hypothetical protein
MKKEFLKEIGYKVDFPLSKISIKDGAPISSWKYTVEKRSKIDSIFQTISQLEATLNKKGESGLENPFHRGSIYAKGKEDPTVGDMWSALCDNDKNTGIVRLVEKWNSDPGDNSLRKAVISEINSFFENIAAGYAMFKTLEPLKRQKPVIDNNKAYLEDLAIGDSEFDSLINILEVLSGLGYTTKDTIVEIVHINRTVEDMKAAFDKVITPDIKRTINDKIESINATISEGEKSKILDNPYHQGYLIALRGENPTIVELLRSNSNIVFYDAWYSVFSGFKGKPLQNAKKLIDQISDGYAFSYLLAYLEDRLNRLSKNSALEEVTESPKGIVVLRWTGQKNQLYHVLRTLKGQDLLTNSYEDLAVFLKWNVDVFKNTSIATINKELGKSKSLPKNRRIDLGLKK